MTRLISQLANEARWTVYRLSTQSVTYHLANGSAITGDAIVNWHPPLEPGDRRGSGSMSSKETALVAILNESPGPVRFQGVDLCAVPIADINVERDQITTDDHKGVQRVFDVRRVLDQTGNLIELEIET